MAGRTIRGAILYLPEGGAGVDTPYAESKPIRIENVHLDPPGKGEVLVQVKAAGICHSDLSVINGTSKNGNEIFLKYNS